jgi:hypothetical protein
MRETAKQQNKSIQWRRMTFIKIISRPATVNTANKTNYNEQMLSTITQYQIQESSSATKVDIDEYNNS